MGNKNKRKKSSESDGEKHSCKQFKYGGRKGNNGSRQKTNKQGLNVSDLISEANSILYGYNSDCDYTDSDEEQGFNQDYSVFSTPGQCNVNIDLVSNTPVTMASGNGTKSPEKSDSEKLNQLLTAVDGLQKGQDNMKRMLESKIDKLRNDMKADIDTKVKVMQDEIALVIGRERTRIEEILITIQSLQSRMNALEQTEHLAAAGQIQDSTETNNGTEANQQAMGQNRIRYRPGLLDDSDISVMVFGLPEFEGEEIIQNAQAIINALSNDVKSRVTIRSATRFRTRFDNRPGPVKITLSNVHEKVLVLRNKMSLKDTMDYKRVFLKSCKSHAERIIELNARTLLRQMPDGHNFRVAANGRIQQREQPSDSQGRN